MNRRTAAIAGGSAAAAAGMTAAAIALFGSTLFGGSQKTATTKWYVSPTGSDSEDCTQSAPCKTLDRGYHLAAPGGTVELAGGSYPAQTMEADSSKTSPAVIIRPAAGAKVTLTGRLQIAASHVEVRDLDTPGWRVASAAPITDVTLLNVIAHGGVFITGAPSNVRVLGGSVGPKPGVWSRNGSQVMAGSSTTPPKNILFDGVSFHDFLKAPGTSDHVDCLHFFTGDGITVRNSTFNRCQAVGLLFTVYGSAGSPTNITVEHNRFGQINGFYAIQLGGGHGESFNHVRIRRNVSTRAGFTNGSTNTLGSDVYWIGNNPPPSGCQRIPAPGGCYAKPPPTATSRSP